MLLILAQLMVSSSPVFVAPQEANSLVQKEQHLIVLDARTNKDVDVFLPRAQRIDWRDYIDAWGPKHFDLWALSRNAKLSSRPEKMLSKLEVYGFSEQHTVLVYGDSLAGLGEEGRIWWMLKYLGFPKVYILDGGIASWKKAGLKLSTTPNKLPSDSKYHPRIVPALRVDIATVVKQVREEEALILDTRSSSEYEGATPYHSSRGGHIPSALHLDWRTLFSSEGRILDKQTVQAKLKVMGANIEKPIITYCTGGVRSALVQAALIHSGFVSVANYDGSWWEWAKHKDLPVEK